MFELDLDGIPDNKAGDFCMHQFPSVNYLMDLRETGARVRVLAAQIKLIPEAVLPGLSPEKTAAVSKACEWFCLFFVSSLSGMKLR